MKNIIIDSHCDTALKLLSGSNINSNTNQFTLNNALKYDKYLQFFAMYIEPEYVKDGEYDLCNRLIDLVKNEVYNNSKYMKIIINKNELEQYFNEKNRRLGVILTVEDASCLEGKIDNLYNLFDRGIRVIGLTWNGKNQIAGGADCSNTNNDGLSKFGEEVVKKMNELGIIIDVSHLSEKSFYDVMKITNKPVMASHSCCKSICNHRRNLSDDQIKLISKNGGIIGVNLYKDFLNIDTNKADIECLVKHIRHIFNIGGKECIGLGSDYDGMNINKVVIGLENNSKLSNLSKYLKRSEFTDEEVDRIMWKNQFEFLKRELK
ncbi:MAG: dipeptidase [Clostridia bacterium]|nr:dipeptidase [Clostridia bacterium]MDD4386516.1 dipeptidase [Clostridia bacterium]